MGASSKLKSTEEAFRQAKRAHARKEKEKKMLVDHLRLILYEVCWRRPGPRPPSSLTRRTHPQNERKKQVKLAELRHKLQQVEGMQPSGSGSAAQVSGVDRKATWSGNGGQ